MMPIGYRLMMVGAGFALMTSMNLAGNESRSRERRKEVSSGIGCELLANSISYNI